MKGSFSVLMFTLLLIRMSTSAFSIQPSNAESQPSLDPAYAQGLQSVEGELQDELEAKDEGAPYLSLRRKLDLAGDEGLQPFGWRNNESGELIVGVDVSKSQMQELEEIIFNEGGNIADSISIGENVRALTVKVPTDCTYIFAEKLQANKLVEYVERNSEVEVFYTPNDPYWSYQWGPAKIEADSAWNITIGSSDLIVAIVDTGIDYTHSDLAANYAPLGYDWVNNDTDPLDDHGHGTHCAGIVAAELNNSVGIAGLAQVRILAEKIFNSTGYGNDFWAAQGIYHAVAAGAKIISMSFGTYTYSQTLHNAVKYAYDHGVLMVASAGNRGMEVKGYPAAYDEVIAVSATDSDDDPAVFSNYGPWIDLSAPGVDIYSTLPGNSYGFKFGTSMACPHVTGVGALAWTMFPNFTRDQIWLLLERNAEDLGDEGFDRYYGHGRVNARKAVTVGLPEHDIDITRWQHKSRLDPGQQDTFNATIFNYGRNNETNISVQFLVNGTLIDSTNISFLETTTFTFVSFSWNTTTIGVYNVTGYVVPVIGESLTENNIVSSYVFVRFPTTLRVPDDYPTIKAAIDSALDGDTILVSEGHYAEGQIDIFKDNIALVADGHVILDGHLGSYVLNVEANHLLIEGFDIRNGTSYGINMRGYFNILRNNTIRNEQGIHVYNSKNSLIIQNELQGNGNGEGFRLSNVNNVTIQDTTINNFHTGIFMGEASHNTVAESTLTNNWEAIWLFSGCDNNTIQGNTIAHGSYGISTNYASYNTITDNLIMDIEGRAIHLDDSSNYNHISRNNITDNGTGIYLDHGSANNILRNNSIAGNWYNFGVHIYGVEFIIQDIDPSNTVDGKPIYYLVNRKDERVPSDAGYVALVNCTNMVVEGLELRNNLEGLLLAGTQNSTIRNNTVASNWYDVKFVHSSNNFLYHNNFMNYGYPYFYGASSNIWDDGYPSGGNYWSNYDGTDYYSGPYQNETGSDGIGDIPYVVNWDNQDNYPLMKPYPWASHDIGIVTAITSKTIVGQGYGLHIDITVFNYGMFTENFNVTIYANMTIVGTSVNVTLTSRNYTSLTFVWNTTGLVKGEYTITAHVTPVLDETNTGDNTLTANWVSVTIPGDIDGDFDVDIYDIVCMADIYSVEKPDPRYDPNCDIDGDGDIDIYDIVAAAGNYGESW